MTAVVLWKHAVAVPCPTRSDARLVVASLLTQARSSGVSCSHSAPDEWTIEQGDHAGRITIERGFEDFEPFEHFELLEPSDLSA